MKRRFRKKLLSSMLTLAIALSSFAGNIPVMAADVNNSSLSDTAQYNAEAQILRSEIDALTGESVAAAAAYKTDYWGSVTVTNTHQGGSHTIYGHQARIAVAFKPLDGNTAISTSLSTGFGSWSFPYNYNYVDSNGYYMYVSDWKNVTYKGSYSMYYKIWTTGNGGVLDGRRASFHVWIDYK